MAEPFAILSVVANIAQFTEYALILVSETREILASARGVTKENLEIEAIVSSIIGRHEALVQSTSSHAGNRPSSRGELAILGLAERCGPISKDMIKILEKLKAKNSSFPKLESLRAALVASTKKSTIHDLRQRLLAIEDEIGREMINILKQIITKIDRLEELHGLNDIKTSTRLAVLLEELRDDASRLSLEQLERSDQALNQVLASINRLSEQARYVEWEQRLLDSLSFEELGERESSIKKAHDHTLGWVFSNPKTNFTQWLESEDDVYWVQGRAGSGKSTLMKYVATHDKTVTALQTWAGGQQVVCPTFFFWGAGLPLQKTQKGLLQSLLYQIFCNCQALMRRVCPEIIPLHWGLEELLLLLQKIGDDKQDLRFKFCLFIDGLDEFEGEPETIVEAVQTLSKSPNIKLCVSSRPWVPFAKAFDHKGKTLVVQNFTEKDMIAYAAQELYKDQRFSNLARSGEEFKTLPTTIAKRAEGVWLWTFLVTRNILRDLTDRDDFESIEGRLSSFPSELEAFYDKMLKADSVDQQEASAILLMAVEAVKPLSVLVLDWLAEEKRNPGFATYCEPRPIQPTEALAVRDSWETRLSNRCRDLLEIHAFTSIEPIWTYRVDFLHRTVRDFLLNSYQPILRQRAPAGFSSARSLCRMTLKLLKSIKPPTPGVDSCAATFSLVDEFLGYARALDMTDAASVELLEEVDHVVSGYLGTHGMNHWTNARPPLAEPDFDEWGQCSFLALAIQAKLTTFVKSKLQDKYGHESLKKQGRPLLDYALRPRRAIGPDFTEDFRADQGKVDIQAVKMLLEHGANPNEKVYLYPGPSGKAQTVWTLFLIYCFSNRGRVPPGETQAWYRTTELLISSGGADLNATIYFSNTLPPPFDRSTRLRREFGPSSPAFTAWTVAQILPAIFSDSQPGKLLNSLVQAHVRRCRQSWGYWLWWGWSVTSWEKRQWEMSMIGPTRTRDVG